MPFAPPLLNHAAYYNRAQSGRSALFDFPATFLPVPFACQRLLDPQFLARLQIERMALDLFDDVFLLYFTFEAPEGVFQGFTVLESHFSQNLLHLQPDHRLHSGRRAVLNFRLSAKVLISYGLDSKSQAHKIPETPRTLPLTAPNPRLWPMFSRYCWPEERANGFIL